MFCFVCGDKRARSRCNLSALCAIYLQSISITENTVVSHSVRLRAMYFSMIGVVVICCIEYDYFYYDNNELYKVCTDRCVRGKNKRGQRKKRERRGRKTISRHATYYCRVLIHVPAAQRQSTPRYCHLPFIDLHDTTINSTRCGYWWNWLTFFDADWPKLSWYKWW